MASKIPDQDCRHMLFKMDASFATDKPVETEIVGESILLINTVIFLQLCAVPVLGVYLECR